jgi:two-component system sensor histidine kinase FlrB
MFAATQLGQPARSHTDSADLVDSRYLQIIELLDVGVVTLDRAGDVELINRSARDLLGGDVTGEAWIRVMNHAFRNPCAGAQPCLRTGERLAVITTALAGGGQLLELRRRDGNRGADDRQAGSGAPGHAWFERVIGGIAHQLRTPLAVVMLQLGRLRGDPKLLRSASASLMGLDRLLNNLLVLARCGHLPRQECTCAALGQRLRELAERSTATRTSPVRYVESGPPGLLYCNQDALASAVDNLLANAADASPPGREVTLRVTAGDVSNLLISVRDHGYGTAADLSRHFVDPFSSSKPDGCGLGLYMSHAIVRAHGGVLSILSSPGSGTTSTISLPMRNSVE